MSGLDDFRVVSLAVNIPGPVAAARLAQMGARVVKIEPPSGDPLALAAPGWYRALHRHQDVATLDLKTAAGQGELRALLAQADILLTASRPASFGRLGLERASLRSAFPRLAHVAIVGHGPPEQNKPGHDLTYQAAAGLVRPPTLPRTVMVDLAGAERAVSAAIQLLLERERGRGGGYLEVALDEVAADFAAPLRHGLTTTGGALGGGLAGYGLYPTSDGWLAAAALEPHFRRRLADELALDDLSHEALAAAFAHRPAAEWEQWASERDLPLVAVSGVPGSEIGRFEDSAGGM
jgi:crotonobetainyl-CoA:carnitine CoA-transferase CaiB-like acyl-CoA transferase